MAGLIHIVYISSSTSGTMLSENDLMPLLEQSRARNARQNVTGMLLYNSGTFMQALEGDACDVTEIYRDICADPRHTNVVTLVNQPIAERTFASWEMGFCRWDGRISPIDGGSEAIFKD
ncbi:MAG: BLUF domain-containing protein, partial [Chromatocurvus sp.]